MKDAAKAAIGLGAAFLLYSISGRISEHLPQVMNFFSIVVIYFSLKKGELFGAFLGTAAGLVQDAFSFGIFGISGLSKTLLGFFTGFISKKINVVPFFRNCIFVFILSALELMVWIILVIFIFSQTVHSKGGVLLFQPVFTAIASSVLFALSRRIKGEGS